MRALIQRVNSAEVHIKGTSKSKINEGLLILLGIHSEDTELDIQKLVRKVINLRIFSDENGKMNRSIQDMDGDILLISQFTLYGNIKKGNRPSFIDAAKPDIAIPLYQKCIESFNTELGKPIGSGEFGADMQVTLTNNGPVTIWYDSRD